MNDLPKIGLSKAVMSAVKLPNGSYNITYHFVLGNYGTGVLNNLSIKDDLTKTFKGDIFSVKSITSLGTLKVNNQYNGNSVIEMLGTGNTLAVGETQRIEMVVNIIPGQDKVTYNNSATAEGSSITGLKTTDESTDGLKPDNGGDVSPKTPTPVDLTRPLEFIPEGFSPNRDGTNDTFVISNSGNKRINLEIYNRWGNIVYKNTDYKNDWAGQSNQGIRVGNDLPEGTYFYVIVLDGKDKYVGSITLKR
jgi:gliding motility-associated-like protein